MEVWYFLPNNIFPEDELRTGRWTKMCNEKHRNTEYYYYCYYYYYFVVVVTMMMRLRGLVIQACSPPSIGLRTPAEY
jgi:hypothetical protein